MAILQWFLLELSLLNATYGQKTSLPFYPISDIFKL